MLAQPIQSQSRAGDSMTADLHSVNEFTVADFLASRLCHDLVGPISAVANGLELLSESPQMEEEAVDLARRSAARATALVQFFRLAFGNAGNQIVRPQEAQAAAQALFLDGRVKLDWSVSPETLALPAGAGKLLLNMILLAADALPRGGRVLALTTGEGAAIRFAVRALGTDAKLAEDETIALAAVTPPKDLTPRTVQAYLAGRLAARFGTSLAPASVAPGEILFEARIAAI
jgi:histidine phosphotransferase ChpT